MDMQTYERLGKIFDAIFAEEQTHAQWEQFEIVLQEAGFTVEDWFAALV